MKVKAILIKTKSDDGLAEVNDGVQIGQVYSVETAMRMVVGWKNIDAGVTIMRDSTWTYPGGFFPCEMLNITDEEVFDVTEEIAVP